MRIITDSEVAKAVFTSRDKMNKAEARSSISDSGRGKAEGDNSRPKQGRDKKFKAKARQSI